MPTWCSFIRSVPPGARKDEGAERSCQSAGGPPDADGFGGRCYNPRMPTLHVGFLLFPRLTQLDLTGPWEVLARVPGVQTHLLARERAPVAAEGGLTLLPTGTLVRVNEPSTPELALAIAPLLNSAEHEHASAPVGTPTGRGCSGVAGMYTAAL